jgi:hypothetical protein
VNELSYTQAFFDAQSGGSLASARIVLACLFERVPVRSVIDVGCGVAPWLKAALELGADAAVGIDGDYVNRQRLLVDVARFCSCDLERDDLRTAVQSGQRFDLTLCMEVTEHLTANRARSFVTELCSFSDLVLFSAAIPDQGGTNHVNEQWPEYWAQLFSENDFACFDVLRPLLWDRADCEWWYVQNALLFAKRGTPAFTFVAERFGPSVSKPMALVHPRKLAQAMRLMSERIAELEQRARLQPFGRDAGIRALEDKVDRLRTMAQKREADLEQAHATETELRAELALLRRECDRLIEAEAAMRRSTSWRMTEPLRWIASAVGR